MSDLSLRIESITSGYFPEIDILIGVSLRAEESRTTCILGPNGAGKSTVLKTVYGFLKPKGGRITFQGKDITGAKPHTVLGEGIAYIPQRRCIFPYLTVRENIEIGAWIFRKDRERVREAIEKIFDRFPELERRRKVKAGNLSGGEQRMLEIGRALMTNPKAILVDEPSGGLAPKIARDTYNKLKELREEGLTILLVDQNVRAAISLSDYVYIIEMGRNLYEGPRDDFSRDMDKIIKTWLHI